MIQKWWAWLAVGLAATPALGQEPPKKTEPPAKSQSKATTPAEEYQSITDSIREQQQAALKKFQEAKDPAEKNKIRDDFMKMRATAQEKMSELAKKHPQEEFAFQALAGSAAQGDAQSIELIVKHHTGNKNIGMLCLQLGMQGAPQGDKLIRAVLEKAKSEDLKGMATLGLAMSLKGQADEAKDDKAIAKLQQEAETLFAKVEKDFGKIATPMGPAGELAKRNLFELRHLSVGKQAPDLAGEDLEDKPLKISDYRGKVIFIDFWAHW